MPNEGYNPNPGFINAETTCELQAKSTDGLAEGCLAFVRTPITVYPAGGGGGKALGTFNYYRLTFIDTDTSPALDVDGLLVLATYNSEPALQQPIPPWIGSVGLPCPALPERLDAHRPGPARWILVSIEDQVFR